jgi:hypothetical protein
MEDKSVGVMFDFLKQFEPKNSKSLLGKIVNKIRKRDEKAKSKMLDEEPMSDFDF